MWRWAGNVLYIRWGGGVCRCRPCPPHLGGGALRPLILHPAPEVHTRPTRLLPLPFRALCVLLRLSSEHRHRETSHGTGTLSVTGRRHVGCRSACWGRSPAAGMKLLSLREEQGMTSAHLLHNKNTAREAVLSGRHAMAMGPLIVPPAWLP